MAQMMRLAAPGGAADGRRHRGAARPRPVHDDRARTGDEPVPARARSTSGEADPAVGVSRAAAGAALRRAGRDRHAARGLRAQRLRAGRDPGGRAARRAHQQGRDRQRGLRAAAAARRATRRRRRRTRRVGPALRPDRAVRPLGARARGRARLPVPPLPDPEGVAGRAPARGPLSRVHPGRHRRRSPATTCRSTTTSRSRGSWRRRWPGSTSCRRCGCRSTTAS